MLACDVACICAKNIVQDAAEPVATTLSSKQVAKSKVTQMSACLAEQSSFKGPSSRIDH